MRGEIENLGFKHYHRHWAHALHSPLMAVTNAISGTTALGGMHLFAHSTSLPVTLLGAAATTLSTVNIVGGYV